MGTHSCLSARGSAHATCSSFQAGGVVLLLSHKGSLTLGRHFAKADTRVNMCCRGKTSRQMPGQVRIARG